MKASPKFKSAIDAAAERAKALAQKVSEKSRNVHAAVPQSTQNAAYTPSQPERKPGGKIEDAVSV
jgi:hypothetical protein